MNPQAIPQGQNWSRLVNYWKGDEGEGTVRDDVHLWSWATELIIVLFFDVEKKGYRAGFSVKKLGLVHTVCGRLDFPQMAMHIFPCTSMWVTLLPKWNVCVCVCVCVCMHTRAQSDFLWPLDCCSSESSVHGIFQAKYWSKLTFPPLGDLSN